MDAYTKVVDISGVPLQGETPGRFEMVVTFDPNDIIKGSVTIRRKGSDDHCGARVGSDTIAGMTEVLLNLMEDIIYVEEEVKE